MGIGRMLAGGAVAGLGLVGAGYAGLAGEDNTTRADDGAIIGEGEIGAFRIRLGDCLEATPAGEVETATGVPCSQPHADEVYHAFIVAESDGQWPGQAAIDQQADDGCLAAFEPFVGTAYEDSVYGIGYFTPTEGSWTELDDREILCLINNYDGSVKTGSARNTAQ